jgi:thiamine-phosphate pyrophosphorylase
MRTDAKAAIRGLYALTPDIADTEELCRRVAAAIEGGARVLQYRNKSASERLRHTQGKALRELCRAHDVTFIVNDDVGLSHELRADGVHMGRDDGDIAVARATLGRQVLIGVSCYDDLGRARSAQREGADYVAFGSFFASSVKPNAVRPPVALLTQAKSALGVPVVAIGGITAYNASQLVEAGADALAVISAVFDAPDIRAAAQAFDRVFAHTSR